MEGTLCGGSSLSPQVGHIAGARGNVTHRKQKRTGSPSTKQGTLGA